MDPLLLTIYVVLLLMALAYAGIIIYHLLRYHREDLPPEQLRHARSALLVYGTVSSIILIASIVTAIILFVTS